MDTEPLVFVGIDWGSTEHQVCLIGVDGPVQRAIAHDADGIGAMVDWLCAEAGQPNHVAVAIETPHGPIVEALVDRDIAVFAINPKQLDRFRDRFSPAGAKDDRRDALVLASFLRTDRHCFRRVEALDPVVVVLRQCSRMAEELSPDRDENRASIRCSSRPTNHGARCFGHLASTCIDSRPRAADAARAHITAVAERLSLVNRHIRNVMQRLDNLVKQLAGPEPGQDTEPRDMTILRSLSEVERVVLATLLAEAHQAIQARNYPPCAP